MLRLRLWSFHVIASPRTNVAKYPISASLFHRTLVISRLERTVLPFARFQHQTTTNSTRIEANIEKTSFSDPTRPDLYYHRIEPPNPISTSTPALALSFLPTQPKSADANSVIGWVPAPHQQGHDDDEIRLANFKENAKFRDVLHKAIREALKEGMDDIQANSAVQLQHGWLHIHDERNVPPLGRIGDPDDIIASVLVEDGVIHAETYQPMPAYRLCTADGLTRLTPGLATKLRNQLEQEYL